MRSISVAALLVLVVEMEYVFLYVTVSLDRVVETEKRQMGVRSRLACLLSKAWIVNGDLLLI